MNKVISLVVLAIFLGTLMFCAGHFDTSTEVSAVTPSNNVTLVVFGFHCDTVERFVYEIRSNEYYVGYNETTLQWLSGLKDKKVFYGGGYNVVMDSDDAIKLPVEDATDVIITDKFTCDVIENRSLGDSFGDILYVKNVEFINQSIDSYDV